MTNPKTYPELWVHRIAYLPRGIYNRLHWLVFILKAIISTNLIVFVGDWWDSSDNMTLMPFLAVGSQAIVDMVLSIILYSFGVRHINFEEIFFVHCLLTLFVACFICDRRCFYENMKEKQRYDSM